MKYPIPLIFVDVTTFLLTHQILTSSQNLFSPLIDSLDPISPLLYPSQPPYTTNILLLTVPHIYINVHGTLYSTKRNLYNLLLYWVHGHYKVLDAKVVRPGT